MMKKYICAKDSNAIPWVTVRSKAALDYEKYIHRTLYPHIIHPYSRFRRIWEFFVLILFPFNIIIFSFTWSLTSHVNLFYQIHVFFIQLLYFVDLILSFFTGYVESATEIVILDPKRIARKYLRSYFVLDLFACIPFELLLYFSKKALIQDYAFGVTRSEQLIIFVTFICVYIKSTTLIKYLKNASKLMLWNPFLYSIIIFCFCFGLMVAVNIFLFALVSVTSSDQDDWSEEIDSDSLAKNILDFITVIIYLLIDLVYAPCDPLDWSALYKTPMEIFNFFFTIFLTVYLIKYLRVKMRATERFFILKTRLRNFAKKRQLPYSLRQKILLYFQVFLQNKYFKEDEIFDYIPDTFKAEILSHHCIPLLKNFYAFENLPMFVLRRLAKRLEYQLYLPNDIVMSRNETKLYMYFVQKGTVAMYSSDNSELYHFEGGSWINGKSFVEGKLQKIRYAISIEISEIYRLSYDGFLEVLGPYPALLENVKKDFYWKERVYQDLVD